MNDRIRRRRRRRIRHTINIIAVVFVIIVAVIAVRAVLKHAKATDVKQSSPPTAAATPSPTPSDEYANFTAVLKTQNDIYNGKLILVNGSNPYKSADPEKMVGIYDNKKSSYKVSDTTDTMSKDIVVPLNSMLDAFYSKTGNDDVTILCGFRSVELQQKLFTQEVAEKGETEAVHWVARPGTSEHHTGLAVDFGVYTDSGEYHTYDGTGDFAWINQNCYKYGFIVRYQTEKKSITGIYNEPWHFRYVGVPHATEMTKLGLCLEEYMEYLRKYTCKNPLVINTDDGSKYETYFCQGLTVYVPKSGSYEVSGNNSDGFIVTVKIS